jgi:hypothetical protein
MIGKLNSLFRPVQLSRWRIACALLAALAADGLQVALGPLGWFGMVQAIDVVAMVLTTVLLRFHLLLLPTFALEFFPVVDLIPTWTGCVIAVIALRKRTEGIAATTVSVVPPSISQKIEQPDRN